MQILYKKKSLKDILENKELGIQEYGARVYQQTLNFSDQVESSDSLWELKIANPSLQIHAKKNSNNTFIAYLNIKWRLEFEYDNGDVKIITISKIHPHKYK